MTISLKAKLVTATLTSVVTIAALVFIVHYDAGTFNRMAHQSQVITSAVRNQTNANMMHYVAKRQGRNRVELSASGKSSVAAGGVAKPAREIERGHPRPARTTRRRNG